MPRRLHLEVELPDEVLTHVRDEDMARKAKEALVMELLREQHISHMRRTWGPGKALD